MIFTLSMYFAGFSYLVYSFKFATFENFILSIKVCIKWDASRNDVYLVDAYPIVDLHSNISATPQVIGFKDSTKVLSKTFFFSNTDNLSLLIQPPQPAEDSSNDKTFSHIRCYVSLISCTLIQKKELSVFIYQ